MASDTAALSMEHSKRYLLQFALQKDPIEAKRYVTACFGKSMYSDRQQAEMEKKLCVGNHKNCHLLFTRGISSEKKQTVPDEIELLQSVIYSINPKAFAPCSLIFLKYTLFDK